MSNEKVRERMQLFVNGCRVSFIQIGKDIGLGAPSRYLISRFLKGTKLNEETLKKVDS